MKGLNDWRVAYDALHRGFRAAAAGPLIGLTAHFDTPNAMVRDAYYTSVLRAGGTPVLLPPFRLTGEADARTVQAMVERLDGLVLTGGADLSPLLLGEEPARGLQDVCEERDGWELLLCRLAADRQLPILGICRGVQVLNAAMGGTVRQDIYTPTADFAPAWVKHSQSAARSAVSHSVTLAAGSLLARIHGAETIAVNSFHHQAVGTVASGFAATAVAADGTVEGIESVETKPWLGVQWHPECLAAEAGEVHTGLFGWLAGEARLFARTKRVHERIVTLDSHCDTPMFFPRGVDIGVRDERLCYDLHKMCEGRTDAVVMAAYIPQGERTAEATRAATARALQLLGQIEEQVARHASVACLARTPDEVARAKRAGLKAVLRAVENGYALGGETDNVRQFASRGVVYVTLCHNGDNDLCGSARGAGAHGGLTELGGRMVSALNAAGILVDVSHASEPTFHDALSASRVPVICSHSSCRALCGHARNVTDEQLRALSRAGGVCQVTLYGGFLRQEASEATVRDVVEHINHAVSVAGIEAVGIGTDFDGDGGVTGCRSASDLLHLTRLLLSERYSESDLEKLWGGNFLRVLGRAQELGAATENLRHGG